MIITPQTDDFDIASDWFVGFEDLGLDGIVAKRAGSPYTPGDRTMVKVKHLRDADCVVGGYRLSKKGDGVGSLLLGLYSDDGVLHYVGHTSSFQGAQTARDFWNGCAKLEGGESFGQGRTPGGPSRWSAGRDTSWVSLVPVLVCEVAYERLQSGRFRHSALLSAVAPRQAPSGVHLRAAAALAGGLPPARWLHAWRLFLALGEMWRERCLLRVPPLPDEPTTPAAPRASDGPRSIAAPGSPTVRKRSGTVLMLRSSGSTSATSSHERGHDTRALGTGRIEYADAIVRSLAFWL